MGALKDDSKGSVQEAGPPSSHLRPVASGDTEPLLLAIRSSLTRDPNGIAPTQPFMPTQRRSPERDPNCIGDTEPLLLAKRTAKPCDPDGIAVTLPLVRAIGPTHKPPPPPEEIPSQTVEYVAPLPPPSETEHRTFEVQTVKVMEQERASRARWPQEVDIPTAPSTRIQRRRFWAIGAVLMGLGVVTGIGLLALVKLALG